MSSLTMIFTALNEEDKIKSAVMGMLKVARDNLKEFEIILLNDGSTDKTGAIMDQLVKEIPEAKVVHNEKPRGIGAAFATGLGMASCKYVTLVPGDEAYSTDLFPDLFKKIGEVDFIITYRTNQFQSRKFSRYVISRTYSFVWANVFSVPIKDLSSLNIYPVELTRKIAPPPDLGFQLEMTIKLLRQNVSFIQMPLTLNTNEHKRASSVLKMGNVKALARTVKRLIKGSKSV